jgi:hypothetical protein
VRLGGRSGERGTAVWSAEPGFGDAFIRLYPEKINSFGID